MNTHYIGSQDSILYKLIMSSARIIQRNKLLFSPVTTLGLINCWNKVVYCWF